MKDLQQYYYNKLDENHREFNNNMIKSQNFYLKINMFMIPILTIILVYFKNWENNLILIFL